MSNQNDDALKLEALQTAERLKQLHAGKKFHKFQLDVFNAIFRDGYKRIFIRKGRKGGGTETAMYPLARIAGTQANTACYFIGPTQKAQSEIVWQNRRIHSFLPREWKAVPNEQEKRLRLPNQSFIKIEGADNPDAARGWEGDIFVWDELKDQNPLSLEYCFPNVMARNAIWIVLGTPPTQKSNHYYQLEQSIKNDPKWKCFHWTAWDNPFLPGGHEALREEKKRYYETGRWDLWEIEYEAQYVFNANRKVLPNFNEKNVAPLSVIMPMLERDKSHLRWVCAIDPGYATCFAALFAAYNPYTGQIYFLDEIYSKDRTKNAAKVMWPEIERKQRLLWNGKWENIYDSAALSFAVEVAAICKDEGRRVHLAPTVKQKSDEDNYFRVLNSLYSDMGQAYVSASCKNFIWEQEEYETDEEDRYVDENNHLLDDARYIVKYLGITTVLKQMESVKVNNEPKGFTPEQDFERDRGNSDMMGFGGESASFDLMKDV